MSLVHKTLSCETNFFGQCFDNNISQEHCCCEGYQCSFVVILNHVFYVQDDQSHAMDLFDDIESSDSDEPPTQPKHKC